MFPSPVSNHLNFFVSLLFLCMFFVGFRTEMTFRQPCSRRIRPTTRVELVTLRFVCFDV